MLEDGELRVGDNINDGPLMDALTNIINNVAATEEEAEKILADMGFDAEVQINKEGETARSEYPIPATYTTATMQTGAGPWTYPVLDSPPQMAPATTATEVAVPALKIKTAKYVGGGNILTKRGGTPAGAARVKNTRPSGSGGSSKKQKTKEPDRYHEINAKIQQNQAEITKLTDLESRLYGQEKLDAMEKEAKLLEEQADLYRQKYEEALRYYEMDKKNLQNHYGATFNPDGTIANYDEWYGKYLAKYNSGKMDDDA